MEILYIYIDNYKILKEANINFGGEYLFEYSKEKNFLDYKENDFYVKDFYNVDANSNQQIKNLTYLVGNNGAGKSTTLEFIKENFVRGLNLNNNTIIIFKKNDAIYCFSTYKINYKFKYFKEIKIIKKINDDKIFDFGFDLRGIENLDIIYFSNIFDGQYQTSNLKGFSNISTNSLIFNDYNFYLEQGLIGKEANLLGIHLSQEVYRQFNFFTSPISREFELFKIPEELKLKIEFNKEIFNLLKPENQSDESIFKIFRNNLSYEVLHLKSEISDSVKSFITNIIANLVKEILHINKSQSEFKIDLKWESNYNSAEDFTDVIMKILKSLKQQIKKNKFIIKQIEDDIDNTQFFIEFILFNHINFINALPHYDDPSFFISIKDNTIIEQMFKLYNKSVKINPYLFFNFEGFSSGERALLNVFSRFYEVNNQGEKFQSLSNDILILMDEPDLYLHPSWQKKLNYYIIKYLPIIFKNKNIQIIITTNSALPLSDILKNNVLFYRLNKENIEVKETIISSTFENENSTFGQNIYNLFKSSFFLDDGLMGDFVNHKLTKLGDYLTNNQSHDEYWAQNASTVIESIGEPIIKNSFRELYFNDDNYKIDEEIKRLETLRKKLNDTN